MLAFTTWIKNLQLSLAEKEILSSGSLLTAIHISAANSLLQKSFPFQNGLQDSHYLSEKNEWNSNPQDFVQIIFIKPNHWACLSNKFSSGNTFELFDSKHTTPSEDNSIIKQACLIAKSLMFSSITVNVIDVTRQVGEADCGLFAVSMAIDLCCGTDPFVQQVIQDQMRTHLLDCFEREKISPFPKATMKESNGNRVFKSVSIDLYCVCRGPERTPMASCDVCMNWFHPDCVSIPNDVFEVEEVHWLCPSCKCIICVIIIT